MWLTNTHWVAGHLYKWWSSSSIILSWSNAVWFISSCQKVCCCSEVLCSEMILSTCQGGQNEVIGWSLLLFIWMTFLGEMDGNGCTTLLQHSKISYAFKLCFSAILMDLLQQKSAPFLIANGDAMFSCTLYHLFSQCEMHVPFFKDVKAPPLSLSALSLSHAHTYLSFYLTFYYLLSWICWFLLSLVGCVQIGYDWKLGFHPISAATQSPC